MPTLDLVCGPGNMSEIPDLIDRVNAGAKKIVATDRINDLNYS